MRLVYVTVSFSVHRFWIPFPTKPVFSKSNFCPPTKIHQDFDQRKHETYKWVEVTCPNSLPPLAYHIKFPHPQHSPDVKSPGHGSKSNTHGMPWGMYVGVLIWPVPTTHYMLLVNMDRGLNPRSKGSGSLREVGKRRWDATFPRWWVQGENIG